MPTSPRGPRRAALEPLDRRVLLAAAAGSVFVDADADGVRDAGEAGAPGWNVFHDANGNGARDAFATQTRASGDVPKAIADNATASSTLAVSGLDGNVAKLTVNLSLAHSYVGELRVALVAPDGRRAVLADQVGGTANGFQNTIFDDAATAPVASGTGLFAGTYRPTEPLAKLDGSPVNGTWTLEVTDLETNDTGTLSAWSLALTPGEALTTSTGGDGAFQLDNLPAGPATLRVQPRAGYDLTSGSVSATLPATGLALGVVPQPGEARGTVFNDLDADGTRDSAEPALANWTLWLDLDRDATRDSGEPTALTNAAGAYAFTGLLPGAYQVRQEVPAGWVQTAPGGAPQPIMLRVTSTAGATADVPSRARESDVFAGLADRAARQSALRFEKLPIATKNTVRTFLVKLMSGLTADALKRAVGAADVALAPQLAGAALVTFAARTHGTVALARLAATRGVEWAVPQLGQSRSTRLVPNDPRFPQQWHLLNTGQSGGTAGQDANVVPAWDGALGTGVVIGIVDDGVQVNHPDLAPNYDATIDYDYVGNDADPSPQSGNTHGTPVAGIAAARGNNGVGVSGAAPNATLTGIRLVVGEPTDAQEAAGLSHLQQTVDIYNNSWGPDDNGRTLEAPGPLTLAALRDVALNGRGGLGGIFVWAGGNGRTSGDDVNYDGYANDRHVIAVAAIDHNGVQSNYSEPGAPLLVSAGSSGVGVGTNTTAVNSGYTNGFGGTSSASPLVAGVVALMLDANPLLTWRDVQDVLARSARKNHATDAGWAQNAAGRWVNHKYGFGAVDAAAAVALADEWANVAPEQTATTGVVYVDAQVPDNGAAVTSSVQVNAGLKVEKIEVVFDARHLNRGDLRVVLTSPGGTQSVLADLHANETGDDYASWRFTSNRHWDEASDGAWTLSVQDRQGNAVAGSFDAWQLIVYGTALDLPYYEAQVESNAAVAGLDFGAHDVLAPELVDAGYRFDRPLPVAELVFSEDVSGSVAGGVELRNAATNAVVPASAYAFAYDAATNAATLTFATPLADGDYTLTASNDVYDASGNALAGGAQAVDFFVLAGDANRDRSVNFGDLAVLATNYGQSGRTFSQGNFDYSAGGTVGFGDLSILAVRYGTTLPAPRFAPTRGERVAAGVLV